MTNHSPPTAIAVKKPGLEERLMSLLDDKKRRYPTYAVLIAGTLLVPFISDNYILEILANSFFYIVLCLGLNIVVGFAGLLDLGYAAFFAVGAYTTGILTSHYGWNFWLTIPAALVFSIMAGMIIGGPTLRLRSDYLAIVTLGFGEITRIAARNLKDISGGPSGLIGISRPSFFGLELNQIQHYYYAFFILVLLAIFVSYRLQHSRLGRAWQYVREDEDAAEQSRDRGARVDGRPGRRTLLRVWCVRRRFETVPGKERGLLLHALQPPRDPLLPFREFPLARHFRDRPFEPVRAGRGEP